MRKKRIIAKTLLLFLTVTGLLFFRPVYAEGSSITVTTDIKDLNQGQSLKLDLYNVPAENSGKTVEEIEALCDRDNWMKADEAIQMGFLDSVVERKE